MANDNTGAPKGWKQPLTTPAATPAAAPAAGAAPPAGAPSGFGQPPQPKQPQGAPGYLNSSDAAGGVPAPSAPGWGINWRTGDVTMPQGVQDWGNVMSNEALMGTLTGLRTQADEARKRLGPAAAASADVVGGAVSPSQLLNVFGPEAAGAAHEALKSYNNQPNWIPTQAGLEKIGADTALGAVSGNLGRIAASPLTARAVTTFGLPAAVTYGSGAFFGAGDPVREAVSMGTPIASALGGANLLNEMGKGAGEFMLNHPAVRQAVRNLTMGVGSAARNAGGPSMYDQWVPGQ